MKIYVWIALGFLCVNFVQAENDRPNIVLILSDDQAWGDYGFMDHPHVQTPHLDSLAASGLTFERGYVAAPICRPSLASMVTGRFSSEHGICGNDVQPGKRGAEREALDQPLREGFHRFPSIIKLLTANGYLTHQSGKWWEGDWKEGGFTHGLKEEGRHGSKASLAIGREGLESINEFMDHALEEEKPFFLWYAPFLPHTPHNPPKRLLDNYSDKGFAQDVAKYYAMIDWFDETCGELMTELDERGLRENTIVLYVCDNGWGAKSTTADWPWDQQFRSYAMRSKGSPYENGARTPIMVSWPGTLEPERSENLAHSIDLFPTIAAAAGIDVPKDLQGINLMDPKAVEARDTVFGESHASHNIEVGNPDATLQYIWCIEGDWKLLLRFQGLDTTGYNKLHSWDTAPYRLFNLKDDPGEKNDLAAAHPEMVSRMKAKIEAWRAELK